MGTLRGPVIYPAVHAKQGQGIICLVRRSLLRTNVLRCGNPRSMGSCKGHIKVGYLLRLAAVGKQLTIKCSFSSSSDGSGSTAENFNQNDDEYVNSSVVEAVIVFTVEIRSGVDGFLIKMRDGYVRCEHNSPHGPLPDYAPHSAIVLKMEDGSGLLLPIIIMEMPSVLLMAAVRNVQIARPTL